MRLLVSIVLNAIALWLVVVLLPGIDVKPFPIENQTLAYVVTYLVLALVWGLVNAIIGRVVKVISLPLYCLTLGLFALIVNGFLFWLVGWISTQIGSGLIVDNFWWAILGAVLLGLFSAILNGLFNRERGDDRDSYRAPSRRD